MGKRVAGNWIKNLNGTWYAFLCTRGFISLNSFQMFTFYTLLPQWNLRCLCCCYKLIFQLQVFIFQPSELHKLNLWGHKKKKLLSMSHGRDELQAIRLTQHDCPYHSQFRRRHTNLYGNVQAKWIDLIYKHFQIDWWSTWRESERERKALCGKERNRVDIVIIGTFRAQVGYNCMLSMHVYLFPLSK